MDNPDRGALSGRRLKDFDLLLVSANYELDLIYIIKLLRKGGVEPLATSRGGRPLIIVGGLAAMSNPEPFIEVADAVFVGDGEVLLERLVKAVHLLPGSKVAFLDSLGEGLYRGVSQVPKVYVQDLDSAPHPTIEIRSAVVKPVYGDGFYVEISRGCRWLCKFCLESFVMYPYRVRSLGTLIKLIERGLRNVGSRRVVIYSLSVFDHPTIRDLLRYLINNEVDFSLPSLRWDTVGREDLELISASSQRTLTLAPEVVDTDLSCFLGKCFVEERFTELAEEALRRGFDLKLYLMVGLPGESEETLHKTANYLRKLVKYAKRLGRKVSITVNPLVPKPHTPLQLLPLVPEEVYQARVRLLEQELSEANVEHLKWSHAFIQALIALGDRRIGRVLLTSSSEGFSRRTVARVAENLGVDLGYPLKCRDVDEAPWRAAVMPLDRVVEKVSITLRQQIREC
ncbi:MAG: B12-binding domain-containing radical SAM protein [Desulfurococcaceae archaeon]|nr:B12-binding domain-containing radical SAM protein [Desulfurococcaceae archaeon]